MRQTLFWNFHTYVQCCLPKWPSHLPLGTPEVDGHGYPRQKTTISNKIVNKPEHHAVSQLGFHRAVKVSEGRGPVVLVSISLVLDLDRVPKRWKDADASISPSRAEKNPRKSAFLSGCSCDPVPVPVLVPSALPPAASCRPGARNEAGGHQTRCNIHM